MEVKMSDSMKNLVLRRNGCRRSKIQRRMFSYSAYIPERRSGKDRRCRREPARKVKVRDMRYHRHLDFA